MAEKKAVIFDLGNVIVNIHFDRCFKSIGGYSGLSSLEVQKKFLFDEAYEQHERGNISFQQYYQHVNAEFKLDLTLEQFEQSWNCIFGEVIAETLDFIKENHLNIQFYVLSNSNVSHRLVWSKKYEKELSYFRKVFCSSQLRMRKPDLEAYTNVLNSIQCAPEQVVFLDDRLDNVEGARSAGIKSILFENPESAISELSRLF